MERNLFIKNLFVVLAKMGFKRKPRSIIYHVQYFLCPVARDPGRKEFKLTRQNLEKVVLHSESCAQSAQNARKSEKKLFFDAETERERKMLPALWFEIEKKNT